MRISSQRAVRIIIFFALLISILATFSQIVSAAESFTLYFEERGGVWNLYAGSEGGVYSIGSPGQYWSVSGSTLTLKNFQFQSSATPALSLADGATLTLEGANSIASTSSGSSTSIGILGTGNLAISGTGSLEVQGGSASGMYSSSCGIAVNSTLIINGSKVIAQSGQASASQQMALTIGISAKSLIVNGDAEVTGIGNQTTAPYSRRAGIEVSSLDISAGVVTAISEDVALSPGVYNVPAGYAYTVASNTEGLYPTIGIGPFAITSNYKYARIASSSTPGPVSFTLYFENRGGVWSLYAGSEGGAYSIGSPGQYWSVSGSTLTLKNFQFQSSATPALSLADGATIILEGESFITSTSSGSFSSVGVLGAGNLAISGTGSLEVQGGSASGMYSASRGIHVEAMLIINSCKVIARSGYASASQQMATTIGITANSLIVNGDAEVTGIGNQTTAPYSRRAGIDVSSLDISAGVVTAIGEDIALSPGGYNVPAGYAYTVASNTEGLYPTIGIGPFAITNIHKYAKIASSSIPGPVSFTLYFENRGGVWNLYAGSEGGVYSIGSPGQYWSVSGSTLTLKNFQFQSSATPALSLADGATIILEGASFITSTSSGSSSTGILGAGNLTIDGTGSLEVQGGSAGGMYSGSRGIYVEATLTINGGKVVARSGYASASSQMATTVGISANSLIVNWEGEVTGIGNQTSAPYSRRAGIEVSSLEISSGVVTAIGEDAALSSGVYNVPAGYAYTVANNTGGLNPTIGTGPFAITSSHKYAKIDAGWPLWLQLTAWQVRDIVGTFKEGDIAFCNTTQGGRIRVKQHVNAFTGLAALYRSDGGKIIWTSINIIKEEP